MLWIQFQNATHLITSYNVHVNLQDGGVYELWVTKANGKNMLIAEGEEERIRELKSALDYAVENNKQIVTLE